MQPIYCLYYGYNYFYLMFTNFIGSSYIVIFCCENATYIELYISSNLIPLFTNYKLDVIRGNNLITIRTDHFEHISKNIAKLDTRLDKQLEMFFNSTHNSIYRLSQHTLEVSQANKYLQELGETRVVGHVF